MSCAESISNVYVRCDTGRVMGCCSGGLRLAIEERG